MNHTPAFAIEPAPSAALPASRDAAGALRASACPGLARIVIARDGGLCRVRLPGGVLRIDEALTLADAAGRFASGVIELTNRANLQLRGVHAGGERALTDALIAAGLGPSSSSTAHASADDVRNLMLSPLAGRDRHALIDTRPLATALLTLLQTDAHCAALSPKFALLLDGGEQLAMTRHAHDLWFAALDAGVDTSTGRNDSPPGGFRFVWGLAGSPSTEHARRSDSAHVTPAIGTVSAQQVPDLVRASIASFTALALPDEHRMRDLLARIPLAVLLADVQTRLPFTLERDPRLADWQRVPVDPSLRFGVHAQRDGRAYAGGQPPLGRIDARILRTLAQRTRAAGAEALHITPWQSLLIPDLAPADAPSVLRDMTSLGFVCAADEPLAHLVACAGSTGCAKSLADTKADARRLATLLHAPCDVHLTGCPRSCASATPHAWTLLAVAPSRYDLFQRDTDATATRFGRCIATALTLEQAAATLDATARSLD